jgi:hypothetical protein
VSDPPAPGDKSPYVILIVLALAILGFAIDSVYLITHEQPRFAKPSSSASASAAASH